MPRRPRFAVPLLVALALTLVSCATTGVNRGDFNLVSIEEEWQLGRQLEADINQQVRIVRDRTLEGYVERIGRRVVAQTELANRSWRFYVVADDALNAFNAPGGLVYINTGLIAASESTAELAGAIAHEVAHGVARHGTERLTTAYGLQLAAGAVLGRNPGAVGQIATQIVAGGALARNSRGAEREADRLGVAYMARAGYDPDGLADVLRTLQRQSGSRGGGFFSTHPNFGDRIQRVEAEAAAYSGRRLTTNTREHASVRSRARRY